VPPAVEGTGVVNEILFQAGICQGIDPAAAEVLDALLVPVGFTPGQVIFAEGEPGDRLYIVIAGKMKIGRTSPDGRESVLMVAGPSDMIGALAMFDPGPRTSTGTALTDVEALAMDRAALRAWIASCPEISERLLQVLARRLRRTNSTLSDMIFTDVPARVAKALLLLARRFGTETGGLLRVEHDLTQAELAALVGASRETVNKALAGFAQRGWVRLETRCVVIVDLDRLGRRAR